jgi:hypothetical protein
MRALSASELLDVWERGLTQRPIERALALLGAACPELSPDELAGFTIGKRDASLLTLRAWTFGPQISGMTACTRCGERLEIALDAGAFHSPAATYTKDVTLMVDGYELRFRSPNSADLAACAGLEAAQVPAELLRRCLIEATMENAPVTADQLPEACAQAISARMAEADPHADIRVDIACPACNHSWPQAFDIVSFFWSEIDAWARRALREVHILASTYGWSESEILELGQRRRQMYLEMAGA